MFVKSEVDAGSDEGRAFHCVHDRSEQVLFGQRQELYGVDVLNCGFARDAAARKIHADDQESERFGEEDNYENEHFGYKGTEYDPLPALEVGDTGQEEGSGDPPYKQQGSNQAYVEMISAVQVQFVRGGPIVQGVRVSFVNHVPGLHVFVFTDCFNVAETILGSVFVVTVECHFVTFMIREKLVVACVVRHITSRVECYNTYYESVPLEPSHSTRFFVSFFKGQPFHFLI